MPDLRTSQRRTNRGPILAIGLAIFAVLFIVAGFWTARYRHAASNDPRTGTTTEISPKNPTPAPGGGADKRGG